MDDGREESNFPIDGLVSVKAITEFLDISPSMWRKLQSNGKIEQPVRIGASARWQASYIRGLAESGV